MTKAHIRSVVVGVDFSKSGDDAIFEAVRLLADGWAGIIHAVHVLDPADVIDHPAMPAMFTEERVLEQAPKVLRERFAEFARLQGVVLTDENFKGHGRIGKAYDALRQIAADYDADLIIVGTHGRSGLERVLLGSVAERLVRNAACPVLVARPKDHSRVSRSERPDPPYPPGEGPDAGRTPEDHPTHVTTRDVYEPPTGVRIV